MTKPPTSISIPELELLENHFDLTQLASAVSDLHACLGVEEWSHLDPETQATCQKIHTILHHPEHWKDL